MAAAQSGAAAMARGEAKVASLEADDMPALKTRRSSDAELQAAAAEEARAKRRRLMRRPRRSYCGVVSGV